ncbi:MAG: hypothetical protein ACUVTD_03955 [Nitrososphaerales archaeon]
MKGSKRMVKAGIIASAIFVIIGCAWLSSSQETLDMVAEYFGASEAPLWAPPLPDYELPGLEGNIFANIATGIAFTLLILAFTFTVGKVLRAKNDFEG